MNSTPTTKSQANLHSSGTEPPIYVPNTSLELACLVANLAEAKKSQNTAILDVEHISGFADFFVIATGQSSPQIKAICQHILKTLKKVDPENILFPVLGYEDDSAGQWHLIDLGEVVVHVMREDVRHHYDIESFWSHGTRIPAERWQQDDHYRQLA